jgi:hypothetical protein
MFLWGLRPQAPGIYRIHANPSELCSLLGLSFSPNPSLVLAPESVLRLLPSRALSSLRSPVVYPRQSLVQRWNEKEIDSRSAFRHVT